MWGERRRWTYLAAPFITFGHGGRNDIWRIGQTCEQGRDRDRRRLGLWGRDRAALRGGRREGGDRRRKWRGGRDAGGGAGSGGAGAALRRVGRLRRGDARQGRAGVRRADRRAGEQCRRRPEAAEARGGERDRVRPPLRGQRQVSVPHRPPHRAGHAGGEKRLHRQHRLHRRGEPAAEPRLVQRDQGLDDHRDESDGHRAGPRRRAGERDQPGGRRHAAAGHLHGRRGHARGPRADPDHHPAGPALDSDGHRRGRGLPRFRRSFDDHRRRAGGRRRAVPMSGAHDYLGNPVSGGDAEALAAVDAFTRAFLAYDAGAGRVVRAAAGRPEHGLLNLYAGALLMLLESPAGRERARPFLAKGQAAPLNDREQRAAAFLAVWVDDDVDAALTVAESVGAEWPRDLVMAKLLQYLCFNRGEAGRMLRSGLAARAAAPDICHTHAMAAFGYEECHLLADGERAARQALEMERREPWAQHALAHVLITEGRIDEGAQFMEGAAETWDGLSSFMATHNWWHLGLFYLSQGREDALLRAYDAHCWAGDKDYSQDQVGAVSLLARAEMAGIDVGDRWTEVAERIAARGIDVEQPFLALQYLYALTRAGRAEAPALLAAIRGRAATSPAHSSAVWGEVAAPVAEGFAAYLAGQYPAAARELALALPRLPEIGGSHAQRDLFEQVWLAALMAGGDWSSAQQALERRRAYDPDGVPLNRQLARAYDALGLPIQAAAARERADATSARVAA